MVWFNRAVAGDFKVINEFNAPEAKQGVAVDSNYIYVISDAHIAKYDKKTYKKVGSWQEKDNGQIKHLDSGMIYKGNLYCANSNYPDVPMTSSIEIIHVIFKFGIVIAHEMSAGKFTSIDVDNIIGDVD